MTPDPQSVLADFAERLGAEILPDLRTPYLMGSAGLMAAAMGMMIEKLDGAAASLVEENRVLRGLFAQAVTLAAPADLAARLEPLSLGGDDDLRLSALRAANRTLRAALIALHAWTENQPGAEALNDAIWAELSASTERRRQSSAPF
jgi:hypothetical protein